MLEVNVTQLRNHLPKYLSSAAKGEEIIIKSHGQTIARIMPPRDTHAEAIKKLKELRQICTVDDVLSPIDEHWNAQK